MKRGLLAGLCLLALLAGCHAAPPEPTSTPVVTPTPVLAPDRSVAGSPSPSFMNRWSSKISPVGKTGNNGRSFSTVPLTLPIFPLTWNWPCSFGLISSMGQA